MIAIVIAIVISTYTVVTWKTELQAQQDINTEQIENNTENIRSLMHIISDQNIILMRLDTNIKWIVNECGRGE